MSDAGLENGAEVEDTQDAKKKKIPPNRSNRLVICCIGRGQDHSTLSLYSKISSRASHCYTDDDELAEEVSDSGCTILYIPEELAKKHKLKISQVDDDKQEIHTYCGDALSLLGQTRLFLEYVKTEALKMIHVIVKRGASE